MDIPIKCRLLRLALVGAMALSFPPAHAQEPFPYSQDELFRMFMASFGVRSPIEPGGLSRDEAKFFTENVVPLVSQGNFRAAIDQLRPNVTAESNANLNYTLGTLYLQVGDLPRAVEQFGIAIQKVPDFLRAHKNLGITHTRLGNHRAAIPSLARVLQLGEISGDVFGLLAYNHFQLGEFASALQAYRMATMLQPDKAEWSVGLLRCLLETRGYGEAAQLSEQLIQSNPQDYRFWINRANALIGLSDYKGAAVTLEALRRTGEAPTQSLRLLGDLYFNDGLYDLAATVYTEYLARRFDPPEVLRLIEYFLLRGAVAPAQRLVSAALPQRQQFTTAQLTDLMNLEARARFLGGDSDEGIRLLRQILETEPLHQRTLLELGKRLAARGDVTEALFYLQRAAAIQDDELRLRALLEMATLRVRQRDYANALRHLDDALAIRDDRRIREYRDAVENAGQRQ